MFQTSKERTIQNNARSFSRDNIIPQHKIIGPVNNDYFKQKQNDENK